LKINNATPEKELMKNQELVMDSQELIHQEGLSQLGIKTSFMAIDFHVVVLVIGKYIANPL
ncbi:hypothetical protein, partial [Actinobacillus pleuropneumoniae]